MANLLEEVALLAYRDDKGRNATPYLHMSLAGAALLELTLSERISVDDSTHVDVINRKPVGHPVVDDVLARISRSRPHHVVSSWVQILSGVDLKTPVLESLVDQHILTHDRDRILGFIPVNRYHPAEASVEDEVRARLERAFNHNADAGARTAALAGIVSTTLMETTALPQHKYSAVTKTFKEICDSFPEIKKIVDGLQLAINIVRSGGASAAAPS